VLAGPIILAVVIVVILPIMFFVTGLAIAMLYGWLFPDYVDAQNEGSELIELNQ
jgi:hypothetical protein